MAVETFFKLYNLIYRAARAFLPIISPLHKKLFNGLKMREKINGNYPWLNFPKNQKPIWFHCSSGEFEYAKPVIREIKRNLPHTKILVTYYTPTQAKNVANFSEVDFATPSPWDQPEHLLEFINHHQPRALFIARTDFWPEMLRQAKKANIPKILFSMTLSENSPRLHGFNKILSKLLFKYIDYIFTVSEKDQNNLLLLINSKQTEIKSIGDTRYDQVIDRLKYPKKIKSNLFQDNNIIVCGSTWSEDEKILFKVIAKNNSLRWVIVPHEPTPSHLHEIRENLNLIEKSMQLYSETNHWEKNSVLIVDQMGILAELYQFAQFAFVGGSFKKSVHSVMEPLAAGCIVLVGPKHQNNREALEFAQIEKNQIYAVNSVQNAEDFIKIIEKAKDSNLHDFIKETLLTKAGASKSISEWIINQNSLII